MKNLFLPMILFLALFPNLAHAIETRDMSSERIELMHSQITSDISQVITLADQQLSGLHLTSSDISKRINELTALESALHSNMAALGYSNEQEERYRRAIGEVIIAYSSYNNLIHGGNQEIVGYASEDIHLPSLVRSPDVNISDALVKEITRVSRIVDMQYFYLQDEINTLRECLANISSTRIRTHIPQDGSNNEFLHSVRMLEAEAARMNAAVSRLQLVSRQKIFDSNVYLMLRLRRRLDIMQENLVFSQEILAKNIEQLELGIKSLLAQVDSVGNSLNRANESLILAKAALGHEGEDALTKPAAEYMLRNAEASYWQYRVSLIHDSIALGREAIATWRNRYSLANDDLNGVRIWALRNEAGIRMEELQQQLDGFRAMESAFLRNVDDVLIKSETVGLSDDVKQLFIRAAEVKRITVSEIFNRYEAMIPDAMLLQRRLYYEADSHLDALHIAEKFGSLSYKTVMAFLNIRLWKGSEGYNVTVGKLIISILVFLSSFVVSSLGSRWVRGRLVKRVNRRMTVVDAVERIVFYVLWGSLVLIALNIVKIPLTAFAFMGGAFVLGLGFGMQDIFNNLISGFILIFSRPFKIHDIIDILGMQGMVIDIGSRATTIKTWDDSDVILPNKYFLENEVTNWTRGDSKKRESFVIGISYTSSIKKAEEVLNYVVKTQRDIMKRPAPFVELKEFADSSINFSVYYWIDLNVHKPPHEPLAVANKIKRRIFAMFKLEGIEIPYPQVDVHFDK